MDWDEEIDWEKENEEAERMQIMQDEFDELSDEEKEEEARLKFAMQCCGGCCSWCGG